MDEVELEDHAEDGFLEDTSYQACFIFRSGDTGSKGRPTKKRKLNGTTSTVPHAFPKLSQQNDSETLAQRRYDLSSRFWKAQQSNFTYHDVDEDSLVQLSSYLTDAAKTTHRDRLRTALLLTGLDGANYDAVLRRVSAASSRPSSNVLVSLQTRQCPNLQTALKNLIKGVIVEHSKVDVYNDFLAKHKRLLPLNFGLELLEQFCLDHSVSQITVSLSDAETFDSNVTNELIHALCSWKGRIPFTLMLGITSTRELFEHRISKSCLKCMEARTFNFAPRKDMISDILHEAQGYDQQSSPVLLDSSIMSVVSDINQMQGKSAQSLKSTLRYLYMSHLFANPVALLSEPETTAFDYESQKNLAQAVRNTESFKIFCENLLAEKDKASNSKVRHLLDNDKVLLQEVKDRVQEGQRAYETSRRVIHGFAELCCIAFREEAQRQKSKLDLEAQLFQAMDDLTDTEAYDEVVRRVQSLTPSVLLQVLGDLRPETVSILDLGEAIDELQTQLRLEQGLDGTAKDDEDPSLADTVGDRISTSTPSTPKRRGKNIKAGMPSAKPAENTANAAKTHLLTALKHKLRTSSLDVSSLLLHEAYVLSGRTTRFKPSFEPHPRAATERALLRPSDYLGWYQGRDNTDTDGSAAEDDDEPRTQHATTMPPASILFTLLQEAPAIINVRDLFDAFRSRFEPAQEMNGTAPDEDEEAELKAHMTQFYRALAELKMVGLVKPSTGTQVKRATKGKNAKSGTQDIDFVAKTSWAGL
ncbi:Origin recognition complex subunit 3 [Knufia fluminis]|uniref:Origin recognition complex subunit 3 n=1 Tax=Knufia fluminis TaxID=191047 RepID=A0AAN8I5Y0_9EURO|nr:Origin recognition complex subunit 3 [Knufia fluminis]